jgi:hypothetical protein
MERRHEAHTQDNYTKVKTAELLEKLKEWEEAHGKWRHLQIEKLKEYLAAVQAAINTAEPGGKIGFPHQIEFVLDEPHSHVKEYNKVIARMEMTVDETIHISHTDFDKYVLDDWAWKRDFAATASLYNG